MIVDHNPLRQYFRRPAIYISLPSGVNYYSPDVVTTTDNNEIPVYPLTAIDEITLKTPDGLYNGSAIAEVIKSCVPNIKNPWALNSVDFDAILVALRIASDGNDQDITSVCPNCTEESTYGINLAALLRDINFHSYDEVLVIGELTFKFKPLAYKDINAINIKQFETQKLLSQIGSMPESTEKIEKMKELMVSISDATMNALCLTIDHVSTPTTKVTDKTFIMDLLRNCDRSMYESIKTRSMDLKERSEIKPMKITCVHCKHEYQQKINLNMSDFFGVGF